MFLNVAKYTLSATADDNTTFILVEHNCEKKLVLEKDFK